MLQAVGRIWGSLCTALVLFLVARSLPGAEFGRLTFYMTLFGLVDSWADCGTSTAVIQGTAHQRSRLFAYLQAGRRVRTMTAVVGWLVIVGLAVSFQEPGPLWIAAAALYPFSRILELSTVVYQNDLEWRVPVATRSVAATLRLAFAVGLWTAGVRDASVYLFTHALGLTVGNVLLHWIARSKLPAQPADGSTHSSTALFRAAWPLGLTAIVQQAYFYVDNLFVRQLEGDVALGHYNAAVRIISLLLMVGAYATSTSLPWLVRAYEEGHLAAATARLGQGLQAAAGLLLGLITPWSAELLAWLFGSPFAAAGVSLQWLLVGALAVYAGGPLLTGLLATGATQLVLRVALSALAVNLVGNTWLVPRFGHEGAAMATVATEVWIGLASVLALRRIGVRLTHKPLAWLGGPACFVAAVLLSEAVSRFAS